MKEIGSEFWQPNGQSDVRFFLSGRTALEFIVRDIVAQYNIRTVYMPSYCCHTMIMPFMLHGFDVHFYDVYNDDSMTVAVPVINGEAVFFCIRYFGYKQLKGLNLDIIRKYFKVIIEDETHSWLSSLATDADYTFVSYKKWAAISGIAKAEKRNGEFLSTSQKRFSNFDELRERAFSLKKQYIETDNGNKSDFLALFNEAEQLLEKDYVNYVPSTESYERLLALDIDGMCKTRRRNAVFLMEGLKSIPDIKLVYHEIGTNDVPLCVPILVPLIRDELRRYLIANDIYLPVHWPLSDYHNGISQKAKQLYDEELSVVCDQRYNVFDMKRIISAIRKFFTK